MDVIVLFGTEIDVDWDTVEVPHLAHSVFDKTFVGVAYVLRQIAEEYELWIGCGQLGDVFNLNPFSFDRWRGILLFDDR